MKNSEVTKSTTIQELRGRISARAINCLLRSRCETVGDITKRADYELMSMTNVGKKTILDIKRFMESHGHALPGWREGNLVTETKEQLLQRIKQLERELELTREASE